MAKTTPNASFYNQLELVLEEVLHDHLDDSKAAELVEEIMTKFEVRTGVYEGGAIESSDEEEEEW